MRQIECLQAGRAIAALAVVAHHANIAANDFGGWHIPWIDYGWLGVDFFFVLSGFIIAMSAEGKTPVDYARARARRVFIPYLPIGLAIALLYVALPTLSQGDREWSWLPTLTLVPFGEPALSVAWTLQHEVMFYLLFGLMFFTGTVRAGLALWVGAIGLGAALGWDAKPFALINLEFIAGVLAYHAYRKGAQVPWWLSVIPFGAWLALGATREWSFLVGFAIVPVMLALVRREVGVHPALMFLGAASYSIYLAHGLAISIGARVYPSLPLLFAIGTLGGIGYYLVIERPLLRKRLKPIGRDVKQARCEA